LYQGSLCQAIAAVSNAPKFPKEPVGKALTKDGGDGGTRIRSHLPGSQSTKAKLHENPRIVRFVFR
jgi:hypothetical protein